MTLSVPARWAILVLYALVALGLTFTIPWAQNSVGYLFSTLTSVALGCGGAGLWYVLIWKPRQDERRRSGDAG